MCGKRITQDMYMCVYVHLCMNIDICICVCICMHMCVWYVFEYMCVVMCRFRYAFVNMWMDVYEYVCMCIYVWLCIELGEAGNGCENHKWETMRRFQVYSLFQGQELRTQISLQLNSFFLFHPKDWWVEFKDLPLK